MLFRKGSPARLAGHDAADDADADAEAVRGHAVDARAPMLCTRLRRLLCMLVRAEIREHVVTWPLDDVTLRIALREVEQVSCPMASCVRLARVLACKLDAVSGLAQICEDVCTKE